MSGARARRGSVRRRRRLRPPDCIAVAPFVGDGPLAAVPDPDGIASRLASELSSRSAARIVAPADLRRDARGVAEPEARDVRRWATWNGVERVVVGRAVPAQGDALDVDVELRSGHSGAPEAEYRLEAIDATALPRAVEELATLILADAGAPARPAPEPSVAKLPSVDAPSTTATGSVPTGASQDDGAGLQLLPGVKREKPISIESEELDVLPQDGGRRLVFSRDVRVVQGDIRLNADRLEVVYPEGSSQPDVMTATGHVSVKQGDREASCEEATYERGPQTILCRGRAEVVQGCDRVRGHEIEFDIARERVRVTGAASVVIRSDDDEECQGVGG